MASLISAATGNFTSSSTWGVVQSQGEVDSEQGTLPVSTSFIDSPTFVPTATAHDGIALKLAARAASPSGTFTVTLRNSTTSTNVQSVTVNVSDLNANGLGWVFFKFASTHTPNGTDSYLVRVSCSTSGSQVTFYRSTTGSNNMSKKLRTTTTAAPGANDHLVICGELTGTGTGNNFTVTMDNTATTTWGPSTVGTQGVYVCQGGTLTCGTASSTNYYFRFRGNLAAAGGGTINFGTSGARIPSNPTLTLEFDCVANADSKIIPYAGGNINMYGAAKTPWTKLTADAASSATSFTCVSTSGWASGDIVAFSPTGVRSEYETKTINTVGSSTTFSTTAGLTASKLGTGPIVCYVQNLTRNIKVQSVSTSLKGNFYIPAAGGNLTVEYLYVDARSIGNGGSNNRIFDIQCTTNSCSLTGVAVNGFDTAGNGYVAFNATGSTYSNITINNCVVYAFVGRHLYFDSATSGTWTVTNNLFIKNADNSPILQLQDVGGTFQGNVVSCVPGNLAAAIAISENGSWAVTSGFDNNEAYFTNTGAVSIGYNMNNGESMRFTASGWKIATSSDITSGPALTVGANCRYFELNNFDFVGNKWAALCFGHTFSLARLNNCTFSSTSTPVGLTRCGLYFSTQAASASGLIYMNNCTFGVASGVRTALNTSDIETVAATSATVQIVATNCTFTNSTLWTNLNTDTQRVIGDHISDGASYLRCQKYNGTSGDHRTFVPQGVIKTDTSIYRTASPSERLTPNSATYKLRSSPVLRAVDNGTGPTVRVYVRKSAVGDGAAYTGNQPRLVVMRNDALGLTTDTVLATASASTGSWELLTASLPTATDDGVFTLYVDCDGTAGWVNVDDWN